MGWGFRPQPSPDVGLDAQAETVVEGKLSGKLLGLQVKAGPSYLGEKTESGFVYRGDKEHLRYWLNHSLPVIIALCDLKRRRVYWQHVTKEKAEATGKGWKTLVPFEQTLGPDYADALQRIAHRGLPFSRFAVRFPRNEGFLGRQDEVSKLHDLLRGGRPVGAVGLLGLGGIGKTQLAVEYAHTHREEYEGGIYWMNAAGGLLEGMVECAQNAGMSEWDADLSSLGIRAVIAERLYRWLMDNPRSLLIVDNIIDPETLRQPILRHDALYDLPCQILFTSRHTDFQDRDFARLPVGTLPPSASLQLLLGDQYEQTMQDPVQWQAAQEICALLGHVALKLEQARTYLSAEQDRSIGDYRNRLAHFGMPETAGAAVLTEKELVARHETSVRAVLRESISRLAVDGHALLTLQVLAEFAENEMVPRHRVALGAGLSQEALRGRPDELSLAVEELRAASLVDDLDGNRLRLHPLVREFIRSLTRDSERQVWLDQLAGNFARGLCSVEYLERRVVAEGIYALLDDFVAADRVIAKESAVAESLRSLHRLLDLGSHNLALWDPHTLPGGFLQHVLNRAVDAGLWELRGRAESILRSRPGVCYLRQVHSRAEEDKGLLRVIAGHSDGVTSIALSPDGRFMASGSCDRTLRVWEVQTGREMSQMRGHSDALSSVAFSPEGRQVVSGSWDGTVRVWDVGTGEQLILLGEHENQVTSVAFSPDGHLVASGSLDRTVRVWETSDWREVGRLDRHDSLISSVAFSHDSGFLASGLSDGTVQVWDLKTMRALARLTGHEGGVNDVAFSPHNLQLASAADDGTVRVWEVKTGKEIVRLSAIERTLRGTAYPRGRVSSVSFSPEGQRLASGADDGIVRVWEVKSGRQLAHLAGHGNSSTSVAFFPEGKRVASASYDRTIRVWEVGSGQESAPLGGHEGPLLDVTFSPEGLRVASGSFDRTARVWEVSTGKQLACFAGHEDWVHSVAFSPDGGRLASGCGHGVLHVWDLEVEGELVHFEEHEGSLGSVPFSPDGRLLGAGCAGGTVRVWSIAEGQELSVMDGHQGSVGEVAFSPDGRLIVSASEDETLRVWEVETAREVLKLEGHRDWVMSARFSPVGHHVASGSADRTVRVWDIETGDEVARLEGHRDAVKRLAFSPEGLLLASGSNDGTLRVWDLATAREIAQYPTAYAVGALWWSPDGRIVKVADLGGGTNRPHVYELELVFTSWGTHA